MERMVHSAERLEIMEALKHTPVAAEAEIAGLPDAALRFKPSPDGWSIKELLGHLRDKAEIWGKRLYMVASQTDPMFTLYDQDALVHERNYQDADVSQLLTEIKALRLDTVMLLANTADWTRLGRHPEVGRRSLRQWAEYLLASELAHLEQVRSLKDRSRLPAAE